MTAGRIGEATRAAFAAHSRAPELEFEVHSEFELQAVRRIVRAIARQRGVRLHSRRLDGNGEPAGTDQFPCRVWFWNPDYEATPADRRERER